MAEGTRILACSKTDPGLQRPRNEDVSLADGERGVFLVADGMGGRAGGDVASRLFQEAALEVFRKGEELPVTEGEARIHRSFALANRKILGHVADHPHRVGMGCTGELLIFCGKHFLVGHVGDSRTYLFRAGALMQLTHDHSFVQDQVDKGIITQQQAGQSRFRNILLRAVGVDPFLSVDVESDQSYPGDIFLLCTDGLSTMLNAGDIAAILAVDGPPATKADFLIKAANDAGGEDNIAVTLVEILG